MVADIPIALAEFFGGVQWVQDPLIKTGMLDMDFDKHIFAGKDGEVWEVQRDLGNPEYFDVVRKLEQNPPQHYRFKPLPTGEIEVAKI